MKVIGKNLVRKILNFSRRNEKDGQNMRKYAMDVF